MWRLHCNIKMTAGLRAHVGEFDDFDLSLCDCNPCQDEDKGQKKGEIVFYILFLFFALELY